MNTTRNTLPNDQHDKSAEMGLTRAAARLAIETTSDAITIPARQAACKLITDTLAVAIAGHTAPGIEPTRAQLREWGGCGEAHTLVWGDALPAPQSAFLNGAMIHALDYDDIHLPGGVHIMCSVFPAALAGAELAGATGRTLVEAVIMGVEVGVRIGAINASSDDTRIHGFFSSSVIGGFGATAAACRVRGMSVDQTVQAFGLCLSQASGSRQALFDMSLAKRLQPGFAARSAMWSSALAQRGVTGGHRALEGSEAGLFRLFSGLTDLPTPETFLEPRDFYEIERASIKRFPACGATHAITQAAIQLSTQHGLTADNIDRVEVYQKPAGDALVDAPFELGETPQVNAQFSTAYGAAVGLLRRQAGLMQITNDQVRDDTEVADLARRVIYHKHMDAVPPSDPVEDGFPSYFNLREVLIVRTRDGRELRHHVSRRQVLDPKLVTDEDVSHKLEECCRYAGLEDGVSQRVLDAVKSLEDAPDIRAVLDSCIHDQETTSGSPSV